MENMNTLIGRAVRAEMARKGWTMHELAANLDIAPTSLSRYLKGDREFPATVLIKAVRALSVSYGDFFNRLEAEFDQVINDTFNEIIRDIQPKPGD